MPKPYGFPYETVTPEVSACNRIPVSLRPVSSAATACPPSCAIVTALRASRQAGRYATVANANDAALSTNQRGAAGCAALISCHNALRFDTAMSARMLDPIRSGPATILSRVIDRRRGELGEYEHVELVRPRAVTRRERSARRETHTVRYYADRPHTVRLLCVLAQPAVFIDDEYEQLTTAVLITGRQGRWRMQPCSRQNLHIPAESFPPERTKTTLHVHGEQGQLTSAAWIAGSQRRARRQLEVLHQLRAGRFDVPQAVRGLRNRLHLAGAVDREQGQLRAVVLISRRQVRSVRQRRVQRNQPLIPATVVSPLKDQRLAGTPDHEHVEHGTATLISRGDARAGRDTYGFRHDVGFPRASPRREIDTQHAVAVDGEHVELRTPSLITRHQSAGRVQIGAEGKPVCLRQRNTGPHRAVLDGAAQNADRIDVEKM